VFYNSVNYKFSGIKIREMSRFHLVNYSEPVPLPPEIDITDLAKIDKVPPPPRGTVSVQGRLLRGNILLKNLQNKDRIRNYSSRSVNVEEKLLFLEFW
jgi:hypothetical protein